MSESTSATVASRAAALAEHVLTNLATFTGTPDFASLLTGRAVDGTGLYTVALSPTTSEVAIAAVASDWVLHPDTTDSAIEIVVFPRRRLAVGCRAFVGADGGLVSELVLLLPGSCQIRGENEVRVSAEADRVKAATTALRRADVRSNTL